MGGRSVTLGFDDPPPELTGEPPRSVTQYAVTLTPQDGSPPITVFVSAEASTNYTVLGLKPETSYDVEVGVVIDTEGQGEETYDLGVPKFSIETSKFLKFFSNGKMFYFLRKKILNSLTYSAFCNMCDVNRINV